MVSEVSAMIRIGASAGFTLRMVGADGRLVGSWPLAALMAVWMSSSAASMLRDSSNWMVTLVEPSELTEVISVTPGIWENCRSSGWAMFEAVVSGLAPGSAALTWMVGKSTAGSAATGRFMNATIPNTRNAAAISDVAIGLRMNGAEMFMACGRRGLARRRWSSRR